MCSWLKLHTKRVFNFVLVACFVSYLDYLGLTLTEHSNMCSAYSSLFKIRYTLGIIALFIPIKSLVFVQNFKLIATPYPPQKARKKAQSHIYCLS